MSNAYLIDMDGVLIKGKKLVPGAAEFIRRLREEGTPFLIPNPYMIRDALRRLGSHSEDTVMIGDRMDTDIMGGVESGMKTIMVLSGLTNREDVNSYPYRPDRIVESVSEIE